MAFNLVPPPGFQGLDPHKPVRVYTRNLPHWRQAGASYFVTFNLADALPATKRSELASMRQEWESSNPPPRNEAIWEEYAKTTFRKVEKWLDAGYGESWFCKTPYASELHRAILHLHEVRYEIGCFAIMANHCHLVIRLFGDNELEDEIGSMKSVVANYLNQHEDRQGPLWQQESYDRIIRDEEHLYRVIQYIGNNPLRAGIARNAWNRWISPKWQVLGWDFHDE